MCLGLSLRGRPAGGALEMFTEPEGAMLGVRALTGLALETEPHLG